MHTWFFFSRKKWNRKWDSDTEFSSLAFSSSTRRDTEKVKQTHAGTVTQFSQAWVLRSLSTNLPSLQQPWTLTRMGTRNSITSLFLQGSSSLLIYYSPTTSVSFSYWLKQCLSFIFYHLKHRLGTHTLHHVMSYWNNVSKCWTSLIIYLKALFSSKLYFVGLYLQRAKLLSLQPAISKKLMQKSPSRVYCQVCNKSKMINLCTESQMLHSSLWSPHPVLLHSS